MFFQNEIFLLDNTHPMLHRMGVIQKRSHCAMCSGIDDKWYLPCNDVVFLPYGDVDERPAYIEPWMAFPHEHNLSIGIWSSSYWSPRGHYSSAILLWENKRENFINSNIILQLRYSSSTCVLNKYITYKDGLIFCLMGIGIYLYNFLTRTSCSWLPKSPLSQPTQWQWVSSKSFSSSSSLSMVL